MTTDWWPAALAHVLREDPWAHDHVIVAEIKSFDDDGHGGERITISALVPISDLDALRQHIAALDSEVRTSGPWPFPRENQAYEPQFWIDAHGLSQGRNEPLVLSWCSHDHTVFLPEPGFLMTYGLVPRSVGNGAVHWDDPAGPVRDIVKVSAPSVYSFPKRTHASVSICREYVQDYLTLRKKALVQSFWEKRFSSTDSEIEDRLGSEECVDLDTPNRRLRLFRLDPRVVITEVSAGRVLAVPGPLPISNDPLESEGLIWPGFDGPIAHARAMAMKPSDCFYVDDSVLADYEGRSDFSVSPESGAVFFGTRWAVGYCRRVGRNLIELELKKLYEGVPAAVTRNWHKFAVEPPPPRAYPAILDEPNIGKRAKALTYAIVSLGENLAALAQTVGLLGLAPDSFVGLRRSDLDYKGWWRFPTAAAIGRHAALNMPVDAFLDRCLSINKLAVESLVERCLRKTLHAMGVPPKEIERLGTLKLLDCVVRMCQVVSASGLSLRTSGGEIWQRLSKNGTDPPQPIPRMFALYDMRVLKAHSSDGQKKLATCLARCGIEPTEAAAGYGMILDRMYDALIAEIASVNKKVSLYSQPIIAAGR